MAFYRISKEFLLVILCALTTLFLHFNSTHNACTALSRHYHCAEGALKMQRHLKERYTISMQTPQTTTAFARRPLCPSAELLLHCRRLYCTAMVTLWRSHCALIRTLRDSACFEHAQSARCRLAFDAIPKHLLVMQLCCCSDACDCTVAPWRSVFFLDAMGLP